MVLLLIMAWRRRCLDVYAAMAANVMRVIFADDHEMMRDGLRPFLMRIEENTEVFEAETFDKVLNILATVSGIRMVLINPRISRLKTAHTLRAIRDQYPDVYVTVLSAETNRKVIQEALELGVAGYIPMRLSAEAMLSALRLIFAGERYVPAVMLDPTGLTLDLPEGRGVHKQNLTPRESEILDLLSEGLPNKLIARRLNVSEVTVKSHLCHVFRKLGVQNRVQAANAARAAE